MAGRHNGDFRFLTPATAMLLVCIARFQPPGRQRLARSLFRVRLFASTGELLFRNLARI
jgi:hypothetical protein